MIWLPSGFSEASLGLLGSGSWAAENRLKTLENVPFGEQAAAGWSSGGYRLSSGIIDKFVIIKLPLRKRNMYKVNLYNHNLHVYKAFTM